MFERIEGHFVRKFAFISHISQIFEHFSKCAVWKNILAIFPHICKNVPNFATKHGRTFLDLSEKFPHIEKGQKILCGGPSLIKNNP